MSVGKAFQNLTHLIREAQFEQPVSFIEHHVFHCGRRESEIMREAE